LDTKLTFKEYNAALKENRLLGLRCRRCQTTTTPPRMVCRKCSSPELDVVPLSGRGAVQTFTTVFVAAEGRQDEVPYIIVMVELDEGPWLMGNLAGIDPAKATMELIGSRVTMSHRLFPGDKYSAGAVASPLFTLETKATARPTAKGKA
jgi:hypothetical protein